MSVRKLIWLGLLFCPCESVRESASVLCDALYDKREEVMGSSDTVLEEFMEFLIF